MISFEVNVYLYVTILQGVFLRESHGFMPHIQMPFSKISGSSTMEINKIGSSLTCDEQRNSLKDCATECFNRSLTNTGCPGFYVDATQNELCYLCHVSNRAEFVGNSSTNIGNNGVIYLLKTVPSTPDLSLNFDNYSGDTIYGDNLIGTASGISDSDHVSGIKDEALYLHDGGKVFLPGSGTDCWTNLDHCSSGMTISIWFNLRAIRAVSWSIVGSGVAQEPGINLHVTSNSKIVFVVITSSTKYASTSASAVSINTWYHLTTVYDGNNGLKTYINGVEDNLNLNTISEAASSTDYDAHIGVSHTGSFDSSPLNGYVDEFKYYYSMLSSVGKKCSFKYCNIYDWGPCA